jgi:outer membrane protein TolC
MNERIEKWLVVSGQWLDSIRSLLTTNHQPLTAALILLPLTLISCRDFGAGGTGEMVVPRAQLRDIQPMDLSQSIATTQESTIAATQPATSQPAPKEVTLTLEQVRQMALQNNMDLKVQLLAPTISKTSLSEAEAQFESLFTANVDYSTTDSPSASTLNGTSVKDLRIQPGLQIPLQTGGTINVAVPMDRFETDNQFSTLNPSYSSDVSMSISQPLLRGAGVDSNAYRIRVSFYDYQISQVQTKLEVIRVLAAVERAYWRLYAAREDLQVRKREYDLAVAQLERARRQVAAGAAAEVEIVRAESGVSDTLETIINADNALRDRQRELKRVINQPGLGMETPTIIIPGTLPNPMPYKLDAEKLVRVALDQRMEMLEQELRIAQENAGVAFARNDMLPLVALDYTYNVNGLGRSFDDSFNMVSDKNFEDHRIGISVQIPIGNEAARSRLRRALASRLQQLATRDQRVATIEQEVYNAVDQLEANWQRILAARNRVILNARLLEAEVRQFEQQLRTSTDVLNAQTNLGDARSAEIAALTEYQISQVDIAFATGMLLGASHVVWDPTPAPTK